MKTFDKFIDELENEIYSAKAKKADLLTGSNQVLQLIKIIREMKRYIINCKCGFQDKLYLEDVLKIIINQER